MHEHSEEVYLFGVLVMMFAALTIQAIFGK